MKAQRAKLSRDHDLAKAFDYLLNRWPAFILFLDDGRVCLSNNAAERRTRPARHSFGQEIVVVRRIGPRWRERPAKAFSLGRGADIIGRVSSRLP